MKNIIKKHALMLLCMYGVKEDKVKKNPEILESFTDLLLLEIQEKIKKCIGCSKD